MREGASFLLVLLSGVLLPQPSWPFPLGGMTVGVETRSSSQEAAGEEVSRVETLYSLGLQQLIPGAGILNGSFLWADEPEFHRLGSFFLQLQGVEVPRHTLSALVGDTTASVSLLQEDRPQGLLLPFAFPRLFPPVTPLFPFIRPAEQFANFFPPSLPFRGLRLDVSSERAHYRIFGGQVTTWKGFLGEVAEGTGELLLGGKARLRLSDRITLGAGFTRTADSAPLPDGSIIREDSTLLMSGQVRVTSSLVLQGEAGLSLHDLETPSGKEQGIDSFLIVGPIYTSEDFLLNANYQRVGPNYPLLRRFGLADREGLFLTTSYRLSPVLSFFGTFERFQTNVARDPRLVTIQTTRGLLGGSVTLPTRTFLLLRGEASDRESLEKGRTGAVDATTIAGQLDVGQSFRHSRGLFRYRREFTMDRLGPDTSNETFRLELSSTFPNLNVLAAQDLVRTFDTRGEETRRTWTSLAGLGYRFSPRFEAFAQVSWSETQDRLARTVQDRLTLDSKFNVSLPFGLSLRLELTYTRAEETESVRTLLRLVKAFEYGETPPQLPATLGRPTVPPFGTIEGVVLTEPGRQGIPKVRILLDEGLSTLTDANGFFTFQEVLEGEHTLRLDLRTLPAFYDLIGPPSQKVLVQPKGRARVEFPAAVLGRISGRVIEDANRNGEIDPDEPGMPDVRILAIKGEERYETFTDLEGGFILDNLKGGTYTIQVDETSVPEGATILPSPSVQVLLEPGGEVKDQTFLIQIPPRPVIRRRF